MTLTIRKIIVLGLIGLVLLIGNILFVANWPVDNVKTTIGILQRGQNLGISGDFCTIHKE